MLAGALCLLGVLAPSAGATAPYAEMLPPLLTPWTQQVSTTAPLPEYPRPQMQRADWENLNGQWQYQQGAAGQAPPFGENLAQTILVPFPVESPLSGIEREDTWGWYRRTFTVPASWAGQHVLLNFGAVSWRATVYVNGQLAGTHQGDYDSFSLDITSLLHPGQPNELIVGFYDPIGAAGEPVGKQTAGTPTGILHTASSGIWQTVWLEPVSADHFTGLDLAPDLKRSRLTVTADTVGGAGDAVVAQALAGGRVVSTATGSPGRPFELSIPHPKLWTPWSPYLYSLSLKLVSGSQTVDEVQSYFGMRSITLGRVDGVTRILLNGKFVFETGALDQGYWPDGLYTPPTDAAMQFDIDAAKRMGYDMLREHQKIQPARWYYWADRLGILVWQDMPSMRVPGDVGPNSAQQAEFKRELGAIVEQRRSDPSIVVWVPFNEGGDQFDPAGVTREVKALDPQALVDTDSGSANCCNAIEARNSDIRDSHLYFGPFAVAPDYRASVIGEYGGVLPYPPPGHRWPGVLTSLGSPVLAWGLGTIETFLKAQYSELTQEMRVRGLSGAVFTELSGYEDELGILTYDRQEFTIPPGFVNGLNQALINASRRPSHLIPQPAAIPAGTTGLWRFSEGHGSTAADSSGHGHALTLEGGAGWTRGPHGGALSITAPGQEAIGPGAAIDTRRSFTISAWLSSRRAGQSGSAVTEPGSDGSAFSLGIDTTRQGGQSLPGLIGRRRNPTVGEATWWTFAVPSANTCPNEHCAIDANMRYDDGRYDPRTGSWHEVTGVYDTGTHTITIYVDGIPEDVEHVFGIPPGRGPLTVGSGSRDYSPTDTFIGAVSELRIYARALSPGEVWQLFRAEASGS
jgi:Concanavalin A-like lectin/glucanases superfamily/Glycosyl hydrolases family 2, sugar binding domain/Glycosyl hydrolases family 2